MFIDDMNMPKVDTYGTQQPIAMLKLLVERGGIYDRGQVQLTDINIVDLMMLMLLLTSLMNLLYPDSEQFIITLQQVTSRQQKSIGHDLEAPFGSGWWNGWGWIWFRKDLNWKNIKDVQFVGAMGRPGGARNPVDPRFISLFSVFEIQFPSDNSLSHIYSAILDGHLQKLSKDVQVYT